MCWDPGRKICRKLPSDGLALPRAFPLGLARKRRKGHRPPSLWAGGLFLCPEGFQGRGRPERTPITTWGKFFLLHGALGGGGTLLKVSQNRDPWGPGCVWEKPQPLPRELRPNVRTAAQGSECEGALKGIPFSVARSFLLYLGQTLSCFQPWGRWSWSTWEEPRILVLACLLSLGKFLKLPQP